jgi:hypothetical protein
VVHRWHQSWWNDRNPLYFSLIVEREFVLVLFDHSMVSILCPRASLGVHEFLKGVPPFRKTCSTLGSAVRWHAFWLKTIKYKGTWVRRYHIIKLFHYIILDTDKPPGSADLSIHPHGTQNLFLRSRAVQQAVSWAPKLATFCKFLIATATDLRV